MCFDAKARISDLDTHTTVLFATLNLNSTDRTNTWYTARSSGGVGTLYVSIKSYSSFTTVASLSISST